MTLKADFYHVFPQKIVTHTVKCFSIIDEAHIQRCSGFFAFFDNQTDIHSLFTCTSFSNETCLFLTNFAFLFLLHSCGIDLEKNLTGMCDKINGSMV